RTSRWIEYSLTRSLGCDTLIDHHGNEQVGDAGRAHVAKRCQSLTIHSIEKHDATTDRVAFVHRLERLCRRGLLGTHHHFQIARLQLFHAAIEYDAAAVNEHDIGEHVLNLVDLMCRHDDGAIVIEVVIQQ